MLKRIGFLLFVVSFFNLVNFAQGDAPGRVEKKPTTNKTTKKPTTVPSKPTTTKPTVSKPAPTPVKTNKPKPSTVKKTVKKTETDISPELSVFINQSQVKIFINEVEYETEKGASPFIFDSLVPSNYTIRVEKEGFEPQSKTISLAPKQKLSLNFDLVAAVGFLDISTTPTDTKIEVENQIFSGQVKGLELREGNYAFSVSKKGYKSISGNVSIENGKTNSQIILLQPINLNEVLTDARRLYETGNYKEALANCRLALSLDSNNSEALLLAGHSYFDLNYYQDSYIYYSLALSKGSKVVFPIRFGNKDKVLNQSGLLSLQGSKLEFSESNTTNLYQTNAVDIQELKPNSESISLKGKFFIGQKQKKEGFFIKSDSSNYQKTQIIFQLIQQLKTGIGYQDKGFGVVYLPAEQTTQIRKSGFSFNIPENWLDLNSDSNTATFAPKGGYKDVPKQGYNISHGIIVGLVPQNENTGFEQLAENNVNALLRANPTHRKKSEFVYKTFEGKRFLTLTIEGYAMVSERYETVTVYYTMRNNNLFYIYTVSTPDEATDYKYAFERILKSIKFF